MNCLTVSALPRSTPSRETYFRYVLHERAEDYERLGWCLADHLQGTSHGRWSVLMVWLCPCRLVEPRF